MLLHAFPGIVGMKWTLIISRHPQPHAVAYFFKKAPQVQSLYFAFPAVHKLGTYGTDILGIYRKNLRRMLVFGFSRPIPNAFY
jgi:hypothetical protein